MDIKRYKITFYRGDKSKPCYLTELSKSGEQEGVRVGFISQGIKLFQDNWKRNRLHGLQKHYFNFCKNLHYKNFKKNELQGIVISFNQ